MSAKVDYTLFDEVAVERLVTGRLLGAPIAPADAAEAVRRLARQGYSDGQIAARLGCRRRSVIRIRNRLGIPAALPSTGGWGHLKHPEAPTRPRERG